MSPWNVRLLAAFLTLSCGNTEGGGVILAGSTPCERVDSLASQVGCTSPTPCTVEAVCAPHLNALLDCIANDLSQCRCEDDGDLNCEGSYDASEGPARCVTSADAYLRCE